MNIRFILTKIHTESIILIHIICVINVKTRILIYIRKANIAVLSWFCKLNKYLYRMITLNATGIFAE